MKLTITIISIILYLWTCRVLYLNLTKGDEYTRRRPKIWRAILAQVLCWIVSGLVFSSHPPESIGQFFLGYSIAFAPLAIAFLGWVYRRI
jgi:hypothetical protein